MMAKKTKKPKRNFGARAISVRDARKTQRKNKVRKVAPKKKTRRAKKVAPIAKSNETTAWAPTAWSSSNHPDDRDIPNERLSRNMSSDPSGNKLALKIAGCVPDPELTPATIQFAPSKVLKVEERFTRGYDASKLGDAKTESQVEFDEVSDGWWIVLEGWPIAFKIGDGKPDLKPGDQLKLAMLKVPA